jgi:integrase/recombinase XerD
MRRKLASLRRFFRLLRRCAAMQSSPMDDLRPNVGRSQRLTRVTSRADFGKLLSTADRLVELAAQGDCLFALRDRAAIWLMCGTGIRVGEVAQLELCNIDIDAGRLVVKGKGGRERIAFLVGGDRERLAAYLAARATVATASQALFVNRSGTPLTTQGLRKIVAIVARSAGVTRHVTPHMLRHTSATRFLEHGANLRLVQEFLGHSSIRSTERYTHVATNALWSALEVQGPLSRE